ncbi:thermonuclease family protein [Ruegeria atlantica]|uniref:thermonuclease family protein n=1 Tax=Ruegeria atlantica TaxID=81569 RepID=UPI00147B6E77|nr:thermonuclease family protein [Ruegeria atlantica]
MTLPVLAVALIFAGSGKAWTIMRDLISPASAQEAMLQGVAVITDGDTLEIRDTRIRLHGIDAPESGQICEDAAGGTYRCGQMAALALADRIGRKPVTCTRQDRDSHGRVVAICHQGATDLNRWLVSNGHALAWRKYSRDYVDAEQQARRGRRGIWAGRFIAPWDWRQGVRLESEHPARAAPTGTATAQCEIKGNISRSGERIYHLPGQRHYTQTRIDTGRGERWFCSETEARAAGWRRARG